jgi:mannose-6-phosphate isomerase-like protein (cupin superfamily)
VYEAADIVHSSCEAIDMADWIKQGTVLRNAYNKETFIFSHPIDDPAVAAFDVVLEEGGSGGGNALVHVHPLAEEIFKVRSGRMKVVIGGKQCVLETGQSATVPRRAPHCFMNASDGTTEITVEFVPAQQHLRFFANFASLAQHRPEWFSAKGDPNLLLIALALDAYRDHLYLAGPPMFLQKLLFAVLAPIARLRGYRLEVAPLGK